MTTRPTLDSLKSEAAKDLADWLEDEPNNDLLVPAKIHEIASSVVPAVTTTLFQMVVDDNSLAFLTLDAEVDSPFMALSEALHAEITNHLTEIIESDEENR